MYRSEQKVYMVRKEIGKVSVLPLKNVDVAVGTTVKDHQLRQFHLILDVILAVVMRWCRWWRKLPWQNNKIIINYSYIRTTKICIYSLLRSASDVSKSFKIKNQVIRQFFTVAFISFCIMGILYMFLYKLSFTLEKKIRKSLGSYKNTY